MATIDITRPTSRDDYDRETTAALLDEPGWSASAVGGNFPAGSEWIRAMMRDPLEAPSIEETVLRSNELTREAVSFAQGRVVIEITDDQAEQLQRFQGRATSPQ